MVFISAFFSIDQMNYFVYIDFQFISFFSPNDISILIIKKVDHFRNSIIVLDRTLSTSFFVCVCGNNCLFQWIEMKYFLVIFQLNFILTNQKVQRFTGNSHFRYSHSQKYYVKIDEKLSIWIVCQINSFAIVLND